MPILSAEWVFYFPGIIGSVPAAWGLMMFQTIIVIILIGLSAAYLGKKMLASTNKKNKQHCSGCGKE